MEQTYPGTLTVGSHSCGRRSSTLQFRVDPVLRSSVGVVSEGLALSRPCRVRSLHSRRLEDVAEGDMVSRSHDWLPSALSGSSPLVASADPREIIRDYLRLTDTTCCACCAHDGNKKETDRRVSVEQNMQHPHL